MEYMEQAEHDARISSEQSPLSRAEQHSANFGATEEQVADRDTEVAPTFTDMEPGAGLNYGASGNPDTPDLGGAEDRTTLGPVEVRPETRDPQPRTSSHEDTSTYGRSPQNGLGGAHPDAREGDRHATPPPDSAAGSAAHQQPPGDQRPHAQADPAPGDSPHTAAGAQGETGAGMLNQEHGEHMGGVGPVGGAPGRGDTPDAVVARNTHQTAAPSAPGVSNTGVNKIDDNNKAYPGLADTGAVTYGHPEAYAADGGLLTTSSGGAGDLPGGHLNMVDVATPGSATSDGSSGRRLGPESAPGGPQTPLSQQ